MRVKATCAELAYASSVRVGHTVYGRFMEQDPRLVARSETGQGTRRIRPESAEPTDVSARARGPRLDPDDLIRARDAELASGTQWRVRLDGTEALWWDSIGGYTTYSSNARKWTSRWDAYNYMVTQHTAQHPWDIEQVPRPGATAAGIAGGARYDDLVQAWTRALTGPGGRPTPEDGVVHALVGENVPSWALCGTEVGMWTGRQWPPKGMRRCERCNSIATALPGG